MNAMAEIRKRYGVPAFRGRKVKHKDVEGVIVGAVADPVDTNEVVLRVRFGDTIWSVIPSALTYLKKPPRERTTRSQVRSALRRLWLHSPEHSAALRRTGYRCEECGVKKSVAKGREVAVEPHHIEEIKNWEVVIDAIFEYILCDPSKLRPLCKPCHKKEHAGEVEP